MANHRKAEPGDGEIGIYTARITLRNGKVLYARQCGLRAFRLVIKPKA
jgi:hypothetical protein